MVELLAKQAEAAGTPLTDEEKEALLQERSGKNQLPEELRQKAMDLIVKIFEVEDASETAMDPKSFSNSMYWADDAGCSNILALAEQVACETVRTAYPPLHGWRLVKDRLQLIGCGIFVVLLMLVIVIVAGVVFHWK
jgi:hypothetical protein